MQSFHRSAVSGKSAQPARLSPPQRIVTAQSVFGGSSSSRNPPDAPKEIIQEGREWIETILSRFGPIRNRAQTVTTLDFEKPLLELDKRITEVGRSSHATRGVALMNFLPLQVRKVADDNGVDVTPQIAELENRARQVISVSSCSPLISSTLSSTCHS